MTIPNWLTVARILLTVLLFIPAIEGWRTMLAAGFVAAFCTDLLDGYLARRLCQISYLGMRLDSFADYFLIAAAAAWLCLLEPGFFTAHPVLWTSVAIAVAVPQAIAMARLGRNAGFHLYSAKAAGWCAAILFLHAILSSQAGGLPLWVFTGVTLIKCTEETLICILVPDPYADPRPSILGYAGLRSHR